ncbi:hypothetical protein CARUB_v10003512mg, partial [Capsella rubella]
MNYSIVNIQGARVNTIIANNREDHFTFSHILERFICNKGNTKKVIGLHTERAQKEGNQNKTALLQLCDGNNCLIFQLQVDDE